MTDPFLLPQRLDSSAAPALLESLLHRRGQPLALDAAGVEVIGTLALEVLVSAGRQWQADGISLLIDRPSPRFRDACGLLGLDAEHPWTPMTQEAA